MSRYRRNFQLAMLALSAVVALAGCGGGESLTYEESVGLLESAVDRTAAGAFSLEDTNISVVETDDSPGEYVDYFFSLVHVPARGEFGYQETFNPYAPPKKSNFMTTVEGRQFEYMESDRCYSDNPYLRVSGGVPTADLLPPIVHDSDKFVSGIRQVEDGSTKEVIEFEGIGGGNFTYTIEDGFLVRETVYIEDDIYGRLVGAGFDGKIIAKKYVRRYYDIGVEKEFPVPEPICE